LIPRIKKEKYETVESGNNRSSRMSICSESGEQAQQNAGCEVFFFNGISEIYPGNNKEIDSKRIEMWPDKSVEESIS
jgi:hypothetical protein